MKHLAWLAAFILLVVEGVMIGPIQTSAQSAANGLAASAWQQTPEADELSAYEEEQAELQKQAKISKDQSIAIAKQKVAGTVQEVELDTEDGTVIYNVVIEDNKDQVMEVKVDAATGNIITVEASDDEIEAAEDME
ncbi:PepSY domain-containing protein [Paenibacillus doosanensis]|uniref:Peptidase propeptide and YPEB domain protein n=1 Tax=Paenibacillus konkukensis TaxID=2020716 RepID=A0ABY4RNR3_9BACL|nr:MULTISPECIES: PepSY domain-containing protein [Paenibacillus]MCS7459034.1 PepSY domain-containing protein [Paenibacillus doosanensis]UQZ84087.1 Peptidase propeptide and YPEB domain protein [Paenibacillus konkukensis]